MMEAIKYFASFLLYRAWYSFRVLSMTYIEEVNAYFIRKYRRGGRKIQRLDMRLEVKWETNKNITNE